MRRHLLPQRARENQVFPQPHVEDQTVEIAILRYHRRRALRSYSSTARMTHTREQFDQFIAEFA